MSYAVKIDVYFDPAFMCEHDWRKVDFGIGTFINLKTCAKCGDSERDAPADIGAINRLNQSFWRNRIAAL